MREKRHCCCCVPLPDGVMLVGIYGTTFHTGLLVIQLTHGASLAPEPHLFEPPYVGEIFKDLLLATHLLGISVNALLCKFFTQLISRKKNPNTIYLFFFSVWHVLGKTAANVTMVIFTRALGIYFSLLSVLLYSIISIKNVVSIR